MKRRFPVELTDLAGKMSEKVRDLSANWDTWAKRSKVLPYPQENEAKEK